jgi:hypothetical protein
LKAINCVSCLQESVRIGIQRIAVVHVEHIANVLRGRPRRSTQDKVPDYCPLRSNSTMRNDLRTLSQPKTRLVISGFVVLKYQLFAGLYHKSVHHLSADVDNAN